MPASKLNYILVFPNTPQVFGCSSKKIAMETPPPKNIDISEKKIYFITLEPDTNNLVLHKVEDNEQETEQ